MTKRLDKRLAVIERRAIEQIIKVVDYELAIMPSAEKKHWWSLSDNGNDLPAFTPCLEAMMAKHGLLQIFNVLKDKRIG
jgi:hypothetical protein